MDPAEQSADNYDNRASKQMQPAQIGDDFIPFNRPAPYSIPVGTSYAPRSRGHFNQYRPNSRGNYCSGGYDYNQRPPRYNNYPSQSNSNYYGGRGRSNYNDNSSWRGGNQRRPFKRRGNWDNNHSEGRTPQDRNPGYSDDITQYFKESMLEDPWQALEERRATADGTSLTSNRNLY